MFQTMKKFSKYSTIKIEIFKMKCFTYQVPQSSFQFPKIQGTEAIQVIQRLANFFDNVKIKKNGLTGTVHFKDDGYLTFGIAYDKCWDILVDGKKTEKEAIAGCFLGVKLEKGEHNVEIRASIF